MGRSTHTHLEPILLQQSICYRPGFLAQEVQSVFPELVKTANNSEGTLSVNYQGMIPVLLNAIKEQQAQIKELKALIKK